jgi:hypothetical protein
MVEAVTRQPAFLCLLQRTHSQLKAFWRIKVKHGDFITSSKNFIPKH